MIKIILIENNNLYYETISKVVRHMDFHTEEELNLKRFTSFSKDLENEILMCETKAIYIIDIDNNVGVDIAHFIRKTEWDNEIILIADNKEKFCECYKKIYNIFDYIEKNENFEIEFTKDLDNIIKHKYNNKFFYYHNRDINLTIYLKHILYVYRDNKKRKTVVVTDNLSHPLNVSLKSILPLLDTRFIQTHKSCILNKDRVEKYDWCNGIFILDTGKEVKFLSQKYKF
ncbi:MAG: LytTR family DNA-binding domain-containing protein [Bacilli bacterium]